jgi:SAM-dependent methyltransferase
MTATLDEDARAFKEFEQDGWQRTAQGYHDYLGKLTRQTVAPLLDAAGAEPGARLLDVASGPGYVAAAAAERGAEALGLDFSSEQVALARRNYPAVEFREGDAENLLFEEGSFDAVTANFGMLHFPEPERAMAEARRVLRGGGRFGFTVWSTADKARGFGIITAAIEAHGDMDVPLPPGPGFFRFSDAAECRRCLLGAGLTDPEVTEVPMTWKLPSADSLIDAIRKGGVRTAVLLKAQAPEALGAIEAAARDEAARHGTADGGVEIPMSAVLASARKA